VTADIEAVVENENEGGNAVVHLLLHNNGFHRPRHPRVRIRRRVPRHGCVVCQVPTMLPSVG
jgi:hypothetical protein